MAARGINKVILIGNLGADPDMRYMPSGGAVANLSVATNDSWKDKTGEMQDRTEWHRVVLFNRLGEIAGEYLRKGSKIYIEGSIRTRKWEDKNGQDRYTTEIIGNELQMLDSRGASFSESEFDQSGQGQNNDQPAPQNTQAAAASQTQAAPQAQAATPATPAFEDDIPF